MSIEQGKKLKNCKMVEITIENPPTNSSTMTEIISADTVTFFLKQLKYKIVTRESSVNDNRKLVW